VLIDGYKGSGTSDIASFDPALAPDIFSAYAITAVFTGLVQLDDHLQLKPQLASSWDVSSDRLTYTFHLKPNLKFSDGTPLTSADVAYSIDRALDPATQSGLAAYYLRFIKDSEKRSAGTLKTLIGDSLVTPDPSTVIIKVASPIAFFLESLTYPTSYVVEKSVITQWGKSWTDHLADNGGQGGAGPFKVSSYQHNKQIVLVPNANYYNTPPQLRELVIPFYKVGDTTYEVYQTNGVDTTTVPLTDYTQAKTRPDFVSVPSLAINYYSMNYNQKPFDVTACRQAFALAINKDLITSSIWKGSYIPTNHIVPKGQYGYSPNLTGPDNTATTSGDPTRAKQLLQQCMQQQGYSSAASFPPITLTYSSGGVQAARDEVAALQQMWQSVLGIQVHTNDIDFNKLVSYNTSGASNPLQFFAGPAWIADYPDPQDWTTLQFDKGSTENGMNFGQNKGPDAAAQQQVQAELEAADLIADPTAREQAYWKAEQQLVNFVAWLPIEQPTIFSLVKPCVQGLFTSPSGLMPPDDWSRVYISTDTPCAKVTQ
jgi:peptide/nickel transport system substrate-binding protein/oligopeptide transport system substrate-binding protein